MEMLKQDELIAQGPPPLGIEWHHVVNTLLAAGCVNILGHCKLCFFSF
jgi:hypothetical protein